MTARERAEALGQQIASDLNLATGDDVYIADAIERAIADARAQALEDAAKVADAGGSDHFGDWRIAAAIRALKVTP